MINSVFSKIISSVKGEDYAIDKEVSMAYILAEAYRRLGMLLRGVIYRLFLKHSGKRLFIGKRVKIKMKKKIVMGGGCTIEDDCYVDALSKDGIKIGNNFKLGRRSTIECTGVISNIGCGLVIGDNVGISERALISVRGKILIGNDVIIGPNVSIQAENHRFDSKDEKIRRQGIIRKGIIIEDNCWLGCNVVILDGVKIGQGSVVAAGAVVTKDVPAGSVVGGVPAKVIKERGSK